MASGQKGRINKIYEKALSVNWLKLKTNLDPRDIVDELIPCDVITIEERGDIWRLNERLSRIQKLIDIVILRGDKRFWDFLRVLRNHHDWICNDIVKTIEENGGKSNIQYESDRPGSPEFVTRRCEVQQTVSRGSPLEHEMSERRSLDVPDSLPLEYQSPRPHSYGAMSPSSEGYYDAMSKPSTYESIFVGQPTSASNVYEPLHFETASTEDVLPQSRNRSSTSQSEEIQNSPIQCFPTSAQYANTSVYYEDHPVYSNMDESKRPYSECERIELKDSESIVIRGSMQECLPAELREIEKCPGWSPSVNDSNKRKVNPSNSEDGSFYLWYSKKADAIVLTLRKSDEKRGCLNYKIRSSKEGGVTKYFFHKDTQFESLSQLIDFTRNYGLALPEKT